MPSALNGYSPRVRELLAVANALTFDRVRLLLAGGGVLEGLLMPRPAFGDPDVIVVKLDNGYNIGISVERVSSITLVQRFSSKKSELHEGSAHPTHREELSKEHVYFLSTGGTIASRVDYVTGAVYPYFTAEELYSMIPELREIARISTKTVFSIFSENMTPQHWSQLALEIERVFREESDIRGVVIAHGTDTLHYTAAAMAFAIHQAPGPIVFVGAQRSSDRPSSDAALNTIGATLVALKAPFAESVIAMHANTSDELILVHRGVRARKMHTSRRDAFMSINALPLAEVNPHTWEMHLKANLYRGRADSVELFPKFSDKVALVKFYPGMLPDILNFYVEKGFKGIVIEGTGLGHVNQGLIATINEAIRHGVLVAMTSQCLWGRVNLNVYRTGVELLKAGVIPAEDMTPETAYVKLSWIFGQTDDLEEAKQLFLTNIAFEYSKRSELDSYPGALRGCGR
ncbi:MAG: Glu-tRNA(Gln) amidotransferase subunit GatD [Thermofilum sp.]|jgi:glutamyl-tRNA(Gln) amidotransferase subunit D|nr:Glu-tRNA(Gln) amidotransferase subunit GatD [Thermofilum sp.]